MEIERTVKLNNLEFNTLRKFIKKEDHKGFNRDVKISKITGSSKLESIKCDMIYTPGVCYLEFDPIDSADISLSKASGAIHEMEIFFGEGYLITSIKMRIQLLSTYYGKICKNLIEDGINLELVPIIYGTRENKPNWKLVKFALKA